MSFQKKELIDVAMEICYIPDFENNGSFEKSHTKISFDQLSLLSGSLASVSPFFRTITEKIDLSAFPSASGKEGFYRVVFPEGAKGGMVHVKNGKELIGTIMAKNPTTGKTTITGQARLIPIDLDPVTIKSVLPVDPLSISMAVVLSHIDSKLDQLQETQEEILNFLSLEKETHAKANLDALTDITKNYKYNVDNQDYIRSKLDFIQHIRRDAAENINFYHAQIQNRLAKKETLHLEFKTIDRLNKLLKDLSSYKMAVYTFAFSSYIEILLLKNFDTDYLQNIEKKLQAHALAYRKLYTDCYNAIEKEAQTTVESHVKTGLSSISKSAGNFIGSIPVIKKGPVDELLLSASKTLKEKDQKSINQTMAVFLKNKDSETNGFIKGVKYIDQISNQPTELYWDKDSLYIPNSCLA